jgi:serine/threonine-protein kinase
MGETPAGLPYLVMEALAGVALSDVLRRSGQLLPDLSLVLARQAATGLAALHKGGIIHGNATPEHWMVLGAPDEPYGVKLLDYGLARLWDDAPARDTEPELGEVDYLAPEQLLLEPLDARTDVYGLGMVLFRMLIGHLPFEASVGHLVRHQLFSAIPQATWLETGLDPRLEAVIVNATRKRRENRYSSMDALLSDLDAVLGLSATPVAIHPLERTPDVCEPHTALGQQRLADLSRRFPSVPPGPASTAGG